MRANHPTLPPWSKVVTILSTAWLTASAALPKPKNLNNGITHLTTREMFQANNTGSSTNNLLADVSFVGYDNYAYRDDIVAAQMVISANASSTRPSRLIVAFPQGNTGFATYLIPADSSSPALQVVPDIDSFTSVTFASSADPDATNQTGVECDLAFNADMTLGVTLIGSIRTVRDYTEGSGLTNEIFNYTLGDYNQTSLQLVRNWINGTTVQYLNFVALNNTQFSVTPNQNVTLPPSVSFERIDKSQNGSMTFSTTFNYTDLPILAPGLDADSLFLTQVPTNGNSSRGLIEVIQALQGNGSSGAPEQVRQVSFLTYEDKFLAGGWRFLTCESPVRI